MTNAFKAVAALIKATRDVHVASVNVQRAKPILSSEPRGAEAFVRLNFGGCNSYYLDYFYPLQVVSEAALAAGNADESQLERTSRSMSWRLHQSRLPMPAPQLMMGSAGLRRGSPLRCEPGG